jgi:hypothetical protein
MAYIGNAPSIDAVTPINSTIAANGNLIPSTDVTGYQSIAVQLIGDWEATVTFQMSNDATNWVNTQGYGFNTNVGAIDTTTANDMYIFPAIGRYFRAVVSNYSYGTVTSVTYLRIQTLAGVGEAALTQAMGTDSLNNGVPINIGFPGFRGAGQQPLSGSFPVALADDQVNDKFIMGAVYKNTAASQTIWPINTNLLSPDPYSTAPIDCSQYKTMYIMGHCYGNAAVTNNVTVETSVDGSLWAAAQFTEIGGASYSGRGYSGINLLSTNATAGVLVHAVVLHGRFVRIRATAAYAPAITNVNFRFMARLSTAPFTDYININTIYNNTPSTTISGGLSSQYSAGSAITIPLNATPLANGAVASANGNPYGANTITGILFSGIGVDNRWRRILTDNQGAQVISGQQPSSAEDTQPVNVRTERTTNGQDSIQDLLQQILYELKALNHYTRETPNAIAGLLQTADWEGFPASMRDEPDNFSDPATTTLRN